MVGHTLGTVRLRMACEPASRRGICLLTTPQVQPSAEPAAGRAQLARLFRVDIARSRLGASLRWRADPVAHVPQYPQVFAPENPVFAAGREPVSPPPDGVRDAALHYHPHLRPLCQVRPPPPNSNRSEIADSLPSFFSVEKTQVRPQTALVIHYTEPGGITGHVMLLCMLLMFTTCVSTSERWRSSVLTEVQQSAQQDPASVLRGFLVHPPPIHHLYARLLHARHRLLRA